MTVSVSFGTGRLLISTICDQRIIPIDDTMAEDFIVSCCTEANNSVAQWMSYESWCQEMDSLECRRFLRARKCFARESAFWNSKREEKMGRVTRSGVGGGEREEKTPARKHYENEKHPLISRAWPLFWKWVADQSTPKNYCTGSSLHFW